MIPGLILMVAIGGFVWVFTGPTDTGQGELPAAVESVFPSGGNLELRQTTIIADLASGYLGYLMLDGIELPPDQVRLVEGLNRLEFTPEPGGDIDLRGRHCAAVVYWTVTQTRDDGRAYRWCFNLT